jgi:hypothetical protein
MHPAARAIWLSSPKGAENKRAAWNTVAEATGGMFQAAEVSREEERGLNASLTISILLLLLSNPSYAKGVL